MKLKIIAAAMLLLDREVESVSIPSLEGELGIYPGHIPMFIGLDKGKVTYRADGAEESVPVTGGYAQVMPDRVIIMTEGSDDGGSRPS